MSLLAFDLETHLIQPGLLAPPIVCGSFAWRNPSGVLTSRLAGKETSLLIVEDCLDKTFVGANVAYDFGCVLAERPELLSKIWDLYESGRVFDVLIAGTLDAIYAGRLSDEGLFARNGKKIQKGRYSLDSVTWDYLGSSDAKKNDAYRKSYATLEHLPVEKWPSEAQQYPLDDAENTLRVAEVQLKSCKNLHEMQKQAHSAFCAHLGAIWGIRTNQKKVAALKSDVDENIMRVQHYAQQHNLLKVGGTKKAPKLVKDTKLIKELVFKAYDGLPPKTDGGDISISRETLQDSGDEVLETFSEGSKWEKLRTYADTLAELGNKPMNVSCNILLSTGRSSYQGLIQLMPRKGGVRECCEAREDTVWSSVDYAAIEMSTLAQVQLWSLGRSKLADAINAGMDPHSFFASAMVGQDYETFFKNRKQEFESGKRQAGKAANFGFPGMMGPVKFVIAKKREGQSVCKWTHKDAKCGTVKIREWKGKELDAPMCRLCVEEAENLRQLYLNHWTDMRPYWKWVTVQLGSAMRLEQFVSKRIRGGLSGPAAANTLFQGLAADGAKAALRKMTKEMYLDKSSPLYGSRLMVFAHDETIIEIPKEKAHEAAMRQATIMVEEMRVYCPDVKVLAEPALMNYWTKDAEPKYVDGRLVPWTS